MGSRYYKSLILNVDKIVPKQSDAAYVDPAFETRTDTKKRQKEEIDSAGTGGFDSAQFCRRLIDCDIDAGNPCRSPSCPECSSPIRRIWAADGLECLDLPPKLEKAAENVVFVTAVDHAWIQPEGDLDSFHMRREGEKFVEKIKDAQLGIQVFFGAWCFLFRTWTPNSESKKTKRFWQPHIHGLVRISGDRSTFSRKLRSMFERKSSVGVDRPTVVKEVKDPLHQLTYTRKQLFGSSVGAEATAGRRMRFPEPLEPPQLEEVSVLLDKQGYKPRAILFGCRYMKGRIVKDQ